MGELYIDKSLSARYSAYNAFSTRMAQIESSITNIGTLFYEYPVKIVKSLTFSVFIRYKDLHTIKINVTFTHILVNMDLPQLCGHNYD